MRALIFLVVTSVSLLTSQSAAQQSNQAPQNLSAKVATSASVRTVDLNVLVLDHEKRPEPNLDGTKFQVSEDGALRSIESVTGADAPVSLCLLIDNSGSTHAMQQSIVDAGVALVKGLPAGSEVMVVHFADNAYLDVPFTPISSVDWSKVRLMESRGGTALYDALVSAENSILAKAHQKRRALVVISDGGDNASKLNLEQAAFRVSVPGSPLIYALAPESEGESPANKEHSERNLKMLTKAGGGITMMARNGKEMASKAEQILVMIDSQIVLSFVSSDPANPEQFHKLDVRFPAGEKREEIHVMPGFYLAKQSR